MNYKLEVEREDEIRCPYCLSWNIKSDAICSECTTTLFESSNLGATRALVSWENVDPRSIKYSFGSEKKDKIDYWNSIFQVQLLFFQKEFPKYNFLSKYAVLDIQDDVEKYFLSFLPMRPEVFKEYKEYEFTTNKNEIELLNYTFRTHPALIFKALAGLSLIHVGRVDSKILQFLHSWDAHYKKLKREKLLSFAHWSVQKINGFTQYSSYANEVMPLYNLENPSAPWAKIFLYKADYDVQDLKFELEEIISEGKFHQAVSACFALRKYDKIKDLLLTQLDESTIELALIYSDERHIPNLLKFLKFSPRKYHENIIRRCVQLKPTDDSLKIQIVDWLLQQEDIALLEVLFRWSEIPKFELVIKKLLSNFDGIYVLDSNLNSWISEFNVRISDSIPLNQILNFENNKLDFKSNEILQNLKVKIKDSSFTSLCDDVKKKTSSENITLLLKYLFVLNNNLSDRQISDGFYSLIKVAENTKSFELPYFNFHSDDLKKIDYSENEFHQTIKNYVLNPEHQRTICNWLFAIYDMLITSKTDVIIDFEFFENHCYLIFDLIYHQQIDSATSCRLFKFIFKLKSSYSLNDTLKKDLKKILEDSNDFEVKYWIDQILES